MGAKFQIANQPIGNNHAPYVIAELSANHQGNLERALALLEVAKKAGADAAKIQTYTADTMTIDHDGSDFQLTSGLWSGRSLYELYEWAHTPWEWHEDLFKRGRELGITVFSTPYDKSAVDFLEQFNPPAYKISSFELVDIPLIEYVASTGKPMILSTGMATNDEIMDAVSVARKGGCQDLCLLHCTSSYPAPVAEMDLQTISELGRAFHVVPGLSDHTRGTTVPIVAVALGACVIEKHLTLKRSDGGPDAPFSLEPAELEQVVQDIAIAHKAKGQLRKAPKPSESPQRSLRRSLYAVDDISAGEQFTEVNIRSIRPGFGLSPRALPTILGRTALTDIPRGTAITWQFVSPEDAQS